MKYCNNNEHYNKCLRKELIKRWKNEKQRVADIVKAIQKNEDWTRYLINNNSHNYNPLKFADSLPVIRGYVGPKDLRGITLSGIDFSNTENLSDTYIDFSSIDNIKFTDAHLYGTSFIHCKVNETDFSGAQLHHSKFCRAKMQKVNFNCTVMSDVNFNDTFINDCKFLTAETENIKVNNEPTLWHLANFLQKNKGTKIRNIKQNLFNEDSEKIDEEFLRFLKEQKQIDHYNKKIPLLNWGFYILSDYGRNFKRLFCNFIILLLAFGFLYSGFYPFNLYIKNKKIENILVSISPSLEINGKDIKTEKISMAYYISFKALTNLGTASVKAVDWRGELYYVTERFFGYLILGVFISMIASRFIESWKKP